MRDLGLYGVPIRYEHILDAEYRNLIQTHFSTATLARDAKFSDVVIWHDDGYSFNQSAIDKIAYISRWCSDNGIKLSGGNILSMMPDFLPTNLLHTSNLQVAGMAYQEYFALLTETFPDLVWHINELFLPDGNLRKGILRAAIEAFFEQPILIALKKMMGQSKARFIWCDYRLQDIARWQSVFNSIDSDAVVGVGIQCHHQVPWLSRHQVLEGLKYVKYWAESHRLSVELSEVSFVGRIRFDERQMCSDAYRPLLLEAGKIPITFWAFHDGLPFPSPVAECGLFDARLQPTIIYEGIVKTLGELV